MPVVDYRNDPILYAKLYADLGITATQFLAFRDIPQLINEYVSGSDTLDYGSGAGESTLYLKSLGLNVHGVDINEQMIKEAKARDQNGSYQQVSSAKVPVDDASYDLVFSSWVLMEVPTKDELQAITKEIARVLKPQGVFIAIVCSEDTYNTNWLATNTEFEENKVLSSGSVVKILFKDINLTVYDYFWTEEDYTEVITNAKLDLIKVHNPLGNEQDGYNWVNEHKKSPCRIYVSRKP
jgi:ubiquinone/menaquinone biosynthesis C-methylase UbiE